MADGRRGGRRTVGGVALALAAGMAAATPIALAGAGRWDGPALADLDLGATGAGAADGRWVVAELERDGRPVPFDAGRPVWLELDTVVAALSGDAGCSPLLGSFILTADGGASFTVPSSGDPSCPLPRRAGDDGLRAALADATSWAADGGELTLAGPTWTVRLVAAGP